MTGFLLNMQILHEEMKKRGIDNRLYLQDDSLCLKGVRIYEQGQATKREFVYLALDKAFLIPKKAEGAFILPDILGEERLPSGCSGIMVPENTRLWELMDQIQQIFQYYLELERQVTSVLCCGGSIRDILTVAKEHFGNLVFYHDEYYQIYADEKSLKKLPDIQYDERKGTYVQDAGVINQFRTSDSYRATMGTKGGDLWESDYDDSRAVYANVWVDGRYKGRLILTEDSKSNTKAQIYEIGYFADAVGILVKMEESIPSEDPRGLEKLIREAISGIQPDKMAVKSELYALNWDSEDTYIFGVLSLIGSDLSRLSIYSICADLEERVSGSYTCYYKGYIYIIVNLTISGLSADELRMRMAYLIRDGLMHMGVSNVFQDFYNFPVYMKQAAVTLQYSERKASTIWYSEFKTYALEYWLSEGFGGLNKKAVMPPELEILKNYDKKNNARLLETLKVYLESERNSTLTAQILKIHRSTLPYRLNHITRLTNLNLDDYNTRLYLMMGFYAMEHI